jgi:hypothetical protein
VLKRAYRCVLDWLEEWTTGCAHLVLVNSSKNEFKRHFLPLFDKYVLLHILVAYPLVHKLPVSPSLLLLVLFLAEFTGDVYRSTFKHLAKRSPPDVRCCC